MEKFNSEQQNTERDWKKYYEAIENSPTKSLVYAISEYGVERGAALDIGAGSLRDTKFLLQEGFEVTALDPSPTSAELAEKLDNSLLTMFADVAGNYSFPENHFSVINAQGILFHFPRERFDFLVNKIDKSMKSGGILCANFIGEKDSWNYENSKYVISSEGSLKEIFSDFEFLSIKESEKDETEEFAQKKGADKPKHWHIISIIARKK